MKRLFAALLMLPLAQAAAQAQGDVAAGKAIWDGPNTQCKNCHGANGEGAFGPDLAGRRQNMGAVDMDFDWFKALVYTHTTALPEHVKRLGETFNLRIRMGNFNPARVSESQLREIYDWAREVGFRARVVSRLSKGEAGEKGITYALTVENVALPGKGLTVG